MGNELLSQGANASSAALIAFILLLLFGTQVLDWRWALLIPLAAAGVGLYRARKRLPSAYAAAQIVDHRMALADTLSTAVFFSQVEPRSRVSPEICESQFERAGRLAQSVDARKAVPFTMPRAVYLMAALLLVASSLFALRYGLSKRLDLKPPLSRLLQRTPGGDDRTEQARKTRRNPRRDPESQDDGGAAVPDQDEKGPGQQDIDSLDISSELASHNAAATASKTNSKKQGEEGDKMAGDEQDSQGDDPGANGGDDQGSSPPSAAKQDSSNNSGENSSLLARVKDAMQNLLSRIRPPQQGSQQSSPDQNSKQGKSQQSGAKQQSAKDGKQQAGSQDSDAQEGQQGQESENSQDSQNQGTGKSDSKEASKQPGSGIGSQDGDKNIKQAEQLAAMGKISEIIGKRSANITGEATVEVQSTSQQLRTPYAQRTARHTEGGAEISRDEIPEALQTYVQQYFEQVRKQAPAKK